MDRPQSNEQWKLSWHVYDLRSTRNCSSAKCFTMVCLEVPVGSDSFIRPASCSRGGGKRGNRCFKEYVLPLIYDWLINTTNVWVRTDASTRPLQTCPHTWEDGGRTKYHTNTFTLLSVQVRLGLRRPRQSTHKYFCLSRESLACDNAKWSTTCCPVFELWVFN